MQCYILLSCCDPLVRAYLFFHVGGACRVLALTSKARAHLFRTLACNSINTITKNTCVCTVGSCTSCHKTARKPHHRKHEESRATQCWGRHNIHGPGSQDYILCAKHIAAVYGRDSTYIPHRSKGQIRVYMLRIHSQLERGVMRRGCVCVWETS